MLEKKSKGRLNELFVREKVSYLGNTMEWNHLWKSFFMNKKANLYCNIAPKESAALTAE